MICHNCHSELEPGAVFCQVCGCQLQQSMPPSPLPQQQQQQKSNTPLIIAVSVLATLLIVGVAFLLFNQKGKSDTATPPPANGAPTVTISNAKENLSTASVATLRQKLIDNPYDHEIIEAWLTHLQNEQMSYEDFAGLSHDQLRLLRNGIYAKHGYSFQRQDLREFFSKYSWYSPMYTASEAASMMNKVEQRNASLIKDIE